MKVVTIDPEIMSGTPCFTGTRVPVQTLIDWIEEGHSLEYFLRNFPTVSKEQVQTYLHQSAELLIEKARETE